MDSEIVKVQQKYPLAAAYTAPDNWETRVSDPRFVMINVNAGSEAPTSDKVTWRQISKQIQQNFSFYDKSHGCQ